MTLSNALVSGVVFPEDEVPVVLLLLCSACAATTSATGASRASTPRTLNVTVNGSLFGLLNFRFRLDEVSPPVNMLSVPTRFAAAFKCR